MKIIMELTQEGTQKIIEYIDDNYEYFPEELEGPIAPKTYRASRRFWLKAFGVSTPYTRDRGIPARYVKGAFAATLPNGNHTDVCISLTDQVAWIGPTERF